MPHDDPAASAATSRAPTELGPPPVPPSEEAGSEGAGREPARRGQPDTAVRRRSPVTGVVVPVVLAVLVTVGLVLTAPRDNAQGLAAQDVLEGRQLRIMAPASPGGGWDQTAREMQKSLRDVIGRSEVVNVGGAGGTIGLSQFTQLEGDPTQVMVTGAVMVGAIESNDSPVSLADVVPIARLTADQVVIVVPSDSAIQNMQDLAALMQADLGGVSIAGGSAGGVEQILAGLMAQALGANPAEVSYVPHSGGGEALTTVLSGAATAAMSSVSEIRPQIEAGSLRAVAVSGDERSAVLADVPTLQESGVDVVLTNWRAVMAAPGIAGDQRAALEEIVREMRNSPGWQQTLERRGWADAFLQGAELETFLTDEQARTAAVLEQLGLG